MIWKTIEKKKKSQWKFHIENSFVKENRSRKIL